MKALRTLGLGILGVIVLLAIAISFMSPTSRVERSIVVNSNSETVFEMVNNYKKFNLWSPWIEMDPDAKHGYEGPDSGVGAKMFWDSEKEEVGKGEQWIVESNPSSYVKHGLKFGDFEGEYTTEFILNSEGEGTKVTWTYQGNVANTGLMNVAMGKIIGNFFLDGMLGEQYEKGLNSLKKLVESMPSEDSFDDAEMSGGMDDMTSLLEEEAN